MSGQAKGRKSSKALASERSSPQEEPRRERRPANAVFVGRLVGRGTDGRALVALGGQAGLSTVVGSRVLGPLEADAVGGDVAVMFERGDTDRAVVLGPIVSRAAVAEPAADGSPGSPWEISLQLDGRRLVLAANEEIVLRCGPASITLSADGRIAIRGTKVLSRASGANKIKGGSVQIN